MHKHFATYRLDLAAQAIYEFTWHEFCDWYLELSKPVLQSDDVSDALKRGTRSTLIEVLEVTLRLLHPLMPFITEEIWQQVAPRAGIDGDTIMLQPFPRRCRRRRQRRCIRYRMGQQFILGIRQIRGEMDISPGKPLPVLLQHASADDRSVPQSMQLCCSESVESSPSRCSVTVTRPPAAATALLGDMRLLVPMKGLSTSMPNEPARQATR